MHEETETITTTTTKNQRKGEEVKEESRRGEMLERSSLAFPAPDFLDVLSRRDLFDDVGWSNQVPINALTASGQEVWPIGYADVFGETTEKEEGEQNDEITTTGRVSLE